MGALLRYDVKIIRGGGSKAIFFRDSDLPANHRSRDATILAVLGSNDARQIDGLGGADVLTSTVAVVHASDRPEADVDYLFGQVAIERLHIDWSENCSDISCAVGLYAIADGLVGPTEPVTVVRAYNLNSGRVLRIEVPVADGKPAVFGSHATPGVPGSGAEVKLDLMSTVGAMTGNLLPTGSPIDELAISELGMTLRVSIVDVSSAIVFFCADDIGMTGTEGPGELTQEGLCKFQSVQVAAATFVGINPRLGLPHPVAVASPRAFTNCQTGEVVPASNTDLLGRRVILPALRLDKAFQGTGAVCAGVAARLAGTVVHRVARRGDTGVVRLGHPSGVIPVSVELEGIEVRRAEISRAARLLAEGVALVPEKKVLDFLAQM